MARPPAISSFKGAFIKDLKAMMYAFGDVENPCDDTAALLEDMLLDYLAWLISEAQLVHAKQAMASLGTPNNALSGAVQMNPTPSNVRLRSEDLLHVLRHDEKKFARVQELLYMNEVVKKARRIKGLGGDSVDELAAANVFGNDSDEDDDL